MLQKHGAQIAKRVEDANKLCVFLAGILTLAHSLQIAGVAENPLHSYFWQFVFVAALLDAGYEDTDYMACALGGVRAKKQRLRHNVAELRELSCVCKHTHAQNEWTPFKATGKWVYPTHEEAEFTADLAFGIAV